MSCLISVIVPIYNASNYLHQCLGNLLNQSFKDMEVILVNDASTDSSLAVCNDAKAGFGDKVKIIDLKENGGPGNARNIGIKEASGEYIGFVDSDDLVDTTMYEKLYNVITKADADIADSAFFSDSRDQANIHFTDDLTGDLDGAKRNVLISGGGYVFTKLYKKSFLIDNNIFFRPVYALEDMDFTIKVILTAKRAANTMDILYHYRDTEGSLSKEVQLEKYYNINYEAFLAVSKVAKDYTDYESISQGVEYALLCLYKNAIVRIIMERIKLGERFNKKYAISLLKKFRTLKQEHITAPIRTNPFITSILEENDIALMEINDKNPNKIIEIADNNAR